MKIKVQKATCAEAMSHVSTEHAMPPSSSLLLRSLVRLYSIADLTATHFSWKREGMERLGKHEPCLILMYPEASYSFDGTATPLPESLGKCKNYTKE